MSPPRRRDLRGKPLLFANPSDHHNAAREYGKNERRHLSSGALFLDTGAILGTMTPQDTKFNELLSGYVGPLVTSTYVVAETIRMLVKSKLASAFVGPGGERQTALARHFVERWLDERNVSVLCVPECIYRVAIAEFRTPQMLSVQCDLNDVISAVIVLALSQRHIAANDGHFRRLNLQILPGDG